MEVRITLLWLSAAAATTCPLSQSELAHDAPYLSHLRSPAPQADLLNCTWYSRHTCCNAEDTLRVSHAEPEIRLRGTTRGCRDALHLLMCSVCAPEQEAIWPSDTVMGFAVPVLHVCEAFCDRLHRECASASLDSDDAVVATRDGTAARVQPQPHDRVDMEFEDGLAFCRAVGLRAVAATDDAACFSAARRRTGAAPTMALALAAAAGVTLLAGRRGLAIMAHGFDVGRRVPPAYSR